MKLELIDYGLKEMPFRAFPNDAGADVYITEETWLKPHQSKAIPLGFGLRLPIGYMAAIYPRSGHAKGGILAQMPPIDSSYTGEIHAIVLNSTDCEIVLPKGERVGQLVVLPIATPEFTKETLELRGNKAFNSTGR